MFRAAGSNYVTVLDPLSGADNWWLALHPDRGDRRLAPRCLGGGRSDVQTPKRGGTLVASRPEMPCLNPFACNLGDSRPGSHPGSRGCIRGWADLVFRPNLVSRVTIDRKPFTLTYHIRPKARWSDGVPVTASDFMFTHQKFAAIGPGIDRATSTARSAGFASSARRRSGSSCGSLRRLATPLSARVPAARAGGTDMTKVWLDRIDDPKTGRRSGTAPSSSGGSSPAGSSPSSGTPATGARTGLPEPPRLRLRPRPADPLGRSAADEIHFALFVGASLSARARSRSAGPRLAGRRWPGPQEILVFRVGTGWSPGAPEEARATRARIRHRPCRDRPGDSELGSRRDRSTARPAPR